MYNSRCKKWKNQDVEHIFMTVRIEPEDYSLCCDIVQEQYMHIRFDTQLAFNVKYKKGLTNQEYLIMSSSSLFEDVCQNIIDLDKTIRFAGITNLRKTIVSAKYRPGLIPLLTQKETIESVEQSILRMSTRRLMEAKLGKILYSITFYEKVKRAILPIGRDGDFVLIVSFDNEADHDSIIHNKIIPLISNDEL